MEPGEEVRPADRARTSERHDQYTSSRGGRPDEGRRYNDSSRGRSRSRERDSYRDSGRGYGRDNRREEIENDSKSAQRTGSEAPAGGAKTSGRRFFRQCPSGWDVQAVGWTEGMEAPSTNAPPSGAHSAISVPTQQTRHARRVYVGGLEAVPESEIAELFSSIIRSTMINPLPADVSPVLSVYINPERKFAFVEVATIELGTALMALDGMTWKGQSLKIRRPHDYKPELLPADLREKAEPLNLAALGQVGLGGGSFGGSSSGTGIGSTGNRDSLHRIFVGGLPTGIDEQQLGELMGAFGAIKHLHVVRGPDGNTKGYGFCEYVDPAVTDLAVQSLNGMSLGERPITVSRAKGGAAPGQLMGMGGAGGFTSSTALPMGMGMDPAALAAAMGMGGGSFAAAKEGPIGLPSRVVCLENMVSVSELEDDSEYKDIAGDIEEEAGKYGPCALQIPRPPDAGSGRVFLHYASLDCAVSAATALDGRKFGSRHIIARYYEEAAFAAGRRDA